MQLKARTERRNWTKLWWLSFWRTGQGENSNSAYALQ